MPPHEENTMKLTELKGIGEKTEKAFARVGVTSAEELLEYFPRDFEVFKKPVAVGEIGYKTFAAIRGMFAGPPSQRRSGKLRITNTVFRDEIGHTIRVTWFNAPYMMDNVEQDRIYILRGKINRKRGLLQLDQPKIFTEEEYEEKMKGLWPVYPLTKGLSGNVITKAVAQAMESAAMEACLQKNPLPRSIEERQGLCDLKYSIRNMHFPESREAFARARNRAAFQEIFLFLYALKQNEPDLRPESSFLIRNAPETGRFLGNLPYELTTAQRNVIREIDEDMSSGRVMNRLIQGDVGSGKTIVALSACMNAAFAGYQAALMAPTEVLATQHFENITALFRKYKVPLKATLLTGSMTPLEKKVAREAIEDGRVQIIIGTHALFQEKVVYNNLALVVTDEQHRFGIKQRRQLTEKGEGPHMLVMSATPIPRTLALIVYGDMDVSVIDRLPSTRKPVKNAVIDDSYKKNTYRLIEREISKGRQAYIICPLVEYSEGVDAQNVESYSEMLREVLRKDISIGMLHGQMPPAKKNDIMERFAAGKIDVLVSTTVVEVGVDVPNATIMVIEDANRFGLASLHQLRGRVGRGGEQSYCIFVCNNPSKEAMERLDILKHSNDGFEIAARDLELRGPGEFMGIRQSGAMNFKHFDLYGDGQLARDAQVAVNDIFSGRLELTDGERANLQARCNIEEGGILL
ncbi:MAG: ATP-dependent DNA helicase RecG [Lachnospiraceae bacterium]